MAKKNRRHWMVDYKRSDSQWRKNSDSQADERMPRSRLERKS